MKEIKRTPKELEIEVRWPHFDPSPSFSENHIADFATKVHMFIMAGSYFQ